MKQELQNSDTPVLLIGMWKQRRRQENDKLLSLASVEPYKLKLFLNYQLGNKADLIHLRQVSTDEGEILAKDFDCKFYEISAAEQVQQVSDAFLDLCREILQAKRKSKQSFIDKIDRMFMGGTGRVYNRGKSDSAAISKE